MNFLDTILEHIREFFNPETIGTAIADFTVNFVLAIFTIAAFYVLWVILRLVVSIFFRSSNLDETSQSFIITIVKYTILLIGLVNAFSIVGIDTAGLLASLGIAGITIGFAARDAFSNLISGILIFLDRPFVIGDLVEVGEFYGRVEEITMRSTRIITPDGKMLAVPNAEIINKTVTSYTNFPNLRLDIQVTIGVSEDVDKSRRVLLSVIEGDPDYLDTPPPRVIVTQLNDYNIALELQAWIKDERMHISQKAELQERVFKAMTKAGIEMPFETIQLSPLKVKMDQN